MFFLKISIGVFLVLASSRFIPHPPNFTSLIALSFYVPALLGTRFIPAVILSFVLTDLIIGFHSTTIFTWGSVLLIGFLPTYFSRGITKRISGALLGAIIFFVGTISTRNILPLIGGYLFLNFNYTIWLKKIPIIDILCISFGFVLRVQSGVMATGLSTSLWLISMTFTLAMLMALGKRKVELNNSDNQLTREALKGYSNFRLIEVEANNRAQASSIVKKLGYEVCSVNMIG